MADIFKPSMYLRQFSIVVVSAVLALDMIPTETRRKVWFSGHTPRYKLKAWYSGHIPRCKVAVLRQTVCDHRPTSACTTYQEHFQYCFANTQ